MVRYLWLVLPFWQHVQVVVVQEADEISPHMWTDAVVRKDKGKGRNQDEEGREMDGEEDPVADAGYEKRSLYRSLHLS